MKIGSGAIGTSSGFTYNSPDPVHIMGAGGRSFGSLGTSLVDTSGGTNPTGHTVLKVLGSTGSTIVGLDATLPGGTGSGNTGIETAGTIEDVAVQAPGGASAPIGVMLDADGALVDSEVVLSLAGSTGVASLGPRTAVRDSSIEAGTDATTLAPGSSLDIASSKLEFSGSAAQAVSSAVTIRGSLLVNRSEAASSRVGLVASSGGGPDASVTADHVTLIGTTDPGSAALSASTTGGAASTVTFRDGIVTGYPFAIRRVATGAGAASITTSFSDYAGGVQQSSGPGTIVELNHLTATPVFADVSNYTLAPGSPLIDAADPAETGGLDGDGDCNTRRDVGAFEFTPGPRAPHAVASASLDGDTATFDAAGTCDPDGGDLAFDWTFDDGGGGPGGSIQRTFSTPGLHFGTVTVTDSTGRSATATASVVVPAAAPPAFPGAVLGASQRVRASKSRLVKLTVGCPAEAIGSCGGTLSVAGRKAAFFFAPGTTHKLAIKLSKKAFKRLKKKKRLVFAATADAHDANGSAKTTTAKITVLKPRR